MENYLEKVYAGFLGMNIGIRLGAPLEPEVWNEESIYKTYGEIKGYVKDYINFAADDDVNGPVYFLRALDDKQEIGCITPEEVGKAWLNYTRDGQGMFWWGGYGISTEHTAYENLKNGIPAPISGSMQLNGKTLAEQIGGQIFIDTWGLINPDDAKKAADDGQIAASVSHDGEGLNGARFLCACIAKAFTAQSIQEIIKAGMEQIPKESTYSKVVKSVEDFYMHNPTDFRACFHMLNQEWGYDKFEGVCHIIPNAGVCALALYYGEGDFSRTIEIATMCGWDTDCNAGNVGTIIGVFCGIEGIPDHYRRPINDSVVLSGISGYLNILDIPTYAKQIVSYYYKQHGMQIPKRYQGKPGEIFFDFILPGSTHNIRVSNNYYCKVNPLGRGILKGENVLDILIDGLVYDSCRVFYKTFYGRRDFSDERYSPVFSPKAYSGQKVLMEVYMERKQGEQLELLPYIKTFTTQKIIELAVVNYREEEWTTVEFCIPDVEGDLIEEVGLILRDSAFGNKQNTSHLYMRRFQIDGASSYSIAMNKQRIEFGTVTPFSTDGGNWTIEGDSLQSHRVEKSFAYTGNYYSKNYRFSTRITPMYGENHLLVFRAKGAMMWYGAGLAQDNKVVLYKNNFGIQILEEVEYKWDLNKSYKIEVLVIENDMKLFINDTLLMEVQDSTFEYGMYGFGSLSCGRTYFSDICYEEVLFID